MLLTIAEIVSFLPLKAGAFRGGDRESLLKTLVDVNFLYDAKKEIGKNPISTKGSLKKAKRKDWLWGERTSEALGDIHMRVLECLLPYVDYLLKYPM